MSRSYDSIEGDIAKARDDLATTLDEIIDRVSPQTLAEEGKVRATALLKDPKVQAGLAGLAVALAELEAHAEAVGAGDAVVFTGRVPHDEVLDHYALIDVFVVPRVDEQAARLVTPLKPFEAMATGLPVLVSDLPALTEITGEGAWGESFAAGDASALTDALERLAGDPGRRAELAAAGRAWVETERSWAANGQRYAQVYEQVLGARA